jgi:hypothetical protein
MPENARSYVALVPTRAVGGDQFLVLGLDPRVALMHCSCVLVQTCHIASSHMWPGGMSLTASRSPGLLAST